MKIKNSTIKLIVSFVLIICTVLIVYFSFPALIRILGYIINLFLPFILGYIFSVMVKPVLNFLQTKFKIPRGISAVIVIILSIGVLGSLLGFIIYRLVDEIRNLYYQFPVIYENMKIDINNVKNALTGVFVNLPINIQSAITEFFNNLTNGLAKFINVKSLPVVSTAGSVAKALPKVLIASVVFLLSSFFMMCDFEMVSSVINKMVKGKGVEKLERLKTEIRNYLGGYIKAQLIIMSITFFIMLISFQILGVTYGLIIALFVAFLDALPFFGSGAVLWPWSIASFIKGDLKLGFGLIITYVIIITTRQFIEPKIVSKNIGMHPILTLMSMYVGYKTLSIGGMILGPIIFMLIISFYRAGVFDGIISVFKGIFKFIKKEFLVTKKYIKQLWESGD